MTVITDSCARLHGNVSINVQGDDIIDPGFRGNSRVLVSVFLIGLSRRGIVRNIHITGTVSSFICQPGYFAAPMSFSFVVFQDGKNKKNWLKK